MAKTLEELAVVLDERDISLVVHQLCKGEGTDPPRCGDRRAGISWDRQNTQPS